MEPNLRLGRTVTDEAENVSEHYPAVEVDPINIYLRLGGSVAEACRKRSGTPPFGGYWKKNGVRSKGDGKWTVELAEHYSAVGTEWTTIRD